MSSASQSDPWASRTTNLSLLEFPLSQVIDSLRILVSQSWDVLVYNRLINCSSCWVRVLIQHAPTDRPATKRLLSGCVSRRGGYCRLNGSSACATAIINTRTWLRVLIDREDDFCNRTTGNLCNNRLDALVLYLWRSRQVQPDFEWLYIKRFR